MTEISGLRFLYDIFTKTSSRTLNKNSDFDFDFDFDQNMTGPNVTAEYTGTDVNILELSTRACTSDTTCKVLEIQMYLKCLSHV